MKKTVSIFLAVLMCLTVFPIAAFAQEDTAGEEVEASALETVDAWEVNYQILIDTLLDNDSYAHYKYVVDNSKTIQQTMDTYTFFGLYDNAWVNYITKSQNTDTCKEILMAMIEKYSYEMGVSYVDEIVKVLETASDAADFIEKLNGYVSDYSDILSFVDTSGWGTTFQVVDILINAGKKWAEIRENLIAVYSEIMSVQLANGYYVELLQYVADNTTYAPMAKAAEDLIKEATTAVQEQLDSFIAPIIAGQTEQLAGDGLTMLANLALDTNVYTAAVKTIYGVGTKVADVLWNTGDQYAAFDKLIASYYAESVIDDYAIASYDKLDEKFDASRTMFATYALISVRSFGEDSLYNLLEKQAGGIINKIKSKVYATSCTEYTANMAALDITEEALFDTEISAMTPIAQVDYIYCPVNVLVYSGSNLLFRVKDGEESTYASTFGFGKSAYCEYNKEYVKVLALKDASYTISLIGTDDGYVTFVKDILENGAVNDYSFTEIAITPETKIVVDGTSYSIIKDGTTTTADLNDDFVLPEGKEVTWETVTDATKEVVTEETTNFLAKIKAFFENLFAKIKALFSFGK